MLKDKKYKKTLLSSYVSYVKLLFKQKFVKHNFFPNFYNICYISGFLEIKKCKFWEVLAFHLKTLVAIEKKF